MTTKALTKATETMPNFLDSWFRPWNEWFDTGNIWKRATVPAVNITEKKDGFELSMAVPGFKKEDFNIDIEGNMLSISSERDEKKEEKEKKYSRMEYSYEAFSRSFTLPEEVMTDKIEAKYENGELKINLPCKQNGKHGISKQVTIK
jgi:HSP20 family protein